MFSRIVGNGLKISRKQKQLYTIQESTTYSDFLHRVAHTASDYSPDVLFMLNLFFIYNFHNSSDKIMKRGSCTTKACHQKDTNKRTGNKSISH